MADRHILVTRFSAMGDVAMTVPVVYSLAKQYPEIKITVVSRLFAKAFYEGLADNIRFIGVDLKEEYNGFLGLNRLYQRLKQENITDMADLHNVLRTKFLRMRFNLDGINTAHIDKHKAGKKQLCRKENKVFEQQPTSFQNYMDVFEELGFPFTPNFESIYRTGNRKPIDLKEKIGVKREGCKWIGMVPFAAHKGKMYPQEKMEEVVKLLTEKHPDWRIFLFGGWKKEIEVFNDWVSKYSICVCVANHLKGLNEELSLMNELDTMVSMDSANMHLASLVGTRVVSIWGATHPYCGFMGWQQKAEDAVQNNELKCRPCSVFGNKPCYRGDFACMNTLHPDTIVAKIEE